MPPCFSIDPISTFPATPHICCKFLLSEFLSPHAAFHFPKFPQFHPVSNCASPTSFCNATHLIGRFGPHYSILGFLLKLPIRFQLLASFQFSFTRFSGIPQIALQRSRILFVSITFKTTASAIEAASWFPCSFTRNWPNIISPHTPLDQIPLKILRFLTSFLPPMYFAIWTFSALNSRRSPKLPLRNHLWWYLRPSQFNAR